MGMSLSFFNSSGSDWFLVLVILPVTGLVIWGLNKFLLHRLKKGEADYSPVGYRKRARLFCMALAALMLLAGVLISALD